LLLAALLRSKGVRTRFATGRLARAEAERLFERIFEARRPAEDESRTGPKRQAMPEGDRFLANLQVRARRDYGAIRAALGSDLPAVGSSRDKVLTEIEAHAWVQAQVNGEWVDLDPSFADATPGRRYTDVQGTFDEFPDEMYQHVTVRVIAESLIDGELQTNAVLTSAFPTQSLLDRDVFLTHFPGAPAGGPFAATGPAKEWTPVLYVEHKSVVGDPVTFSETASGSGGVGDLFGSALSSPAVLVAEWLEFEIAFPDGKREVARRVLLDRAGIAWRRSGSLDAAALAPIATNSDGPIAPQALHNVWFSAGLHDMAGFARRLAEFGRSPQPKTGESEAGEPDLAGAMRPFALQTFQFLVWTDELAIPALNDAPGVRMYADSPRISVHSTGPDPAAKGVGFVQVDLRRDHLRGVARDHAGETAILERKLWFGAFEGALEHEVFALQTDDAGKRAVRTTSNLLDAAGVVVFRPGDADRVRDQVPSVETRERIASALATGAVLVVPRRALKGDEAGWWEIASAEGDVRAVLGPDLNAGREPCPLRPDRLGAKLLKVEKKKGGATEWLAVTEKVAIDSINVVIVSTRGATLFWGACILALEYVVYRLL
jgi:hypothetical protein